MNIPAPTTTGEAYRRACHRPATVATSPYLAALAERVLVYDGAMGTSIQRFELGADDFGGAAHEGCNDHLPITRPEAIARVHRSFLEVGSCVIETCTFQATRLRLAEWGLETPIEHNVVAALLARAVADRVAQETGVPRFVAGSVGPTGFLPSADDPELGKLGYADLVPIFEEQCLALLLGGVDALLIETGQDLLEMRAALTGAKRARARIRARHAERPMPLDARTLLLDADPAAVRAHPLAATIAATWHALGASAHGEAWLAEAAAQASDTQAAAPRTPAGGVLPWQCGHDAAIVAQPTLDATGRMLLGTDIAAALVTLEAMGAEGVGLNCSTGPHEMKDAVRYLGEHARVPVSCIPNAGLPENRGDGEAYYPLGADELATALATFVRDFGINVIGGCCGTTPEHLRAVVAATRDLHPAPRATERPPAVASGMTAVTLDQEPKPALVGERVNTQGSRKVKRLLIAGDYDGVVGVARQQLETGAHLLDVCVALTERDDEPAQMRALIKKLSLSVDRPLMIDSTDATAIQAALQACPGRAAVNSINLENGLERIRAVCPLIEEHGACVVALTIDREFGGMARDAETKFAVAKKIHDIVTHDYAIRAEDLIVDCLTFTLATGEPEFARSAVETLEGLARIKKGLPGVRTILGVSNVSFGLRERARAVLNSVFLYHAVHAGLDLAIVNPAHVIPIGELTAKERQLAENLVFARGADALPQYIEYFEAHGATMQSAATAEPVDLEVEPLIHHKILHRKPDGIEALVDQAVTRQEAVAVLNRVLLPAMKEVGDKFGSGELILPFVLQSAEVMKRAVAHLERHLEKIEGASKGTIVLATVYGDVHDIGKNLVRTILSNNGYTVHDLGKQVPIATILDAAQEKRADAIGLSALLVNTSRQMPLIVRELHQQGRRTPVLIGGAAINRRFGDRASFPDGAPKVDADGAAEVDAEAGAETPAPAAPVQYAGGVFYCKDAFEALATLDRLRADAGKQAAEVAAERNRAALADVLAPRLAQASLTRDDEAALEARHRPRPVERLPAPPFWGTRTLGPAQIPLAEVYACIDFVSLYKLQWGVKGRSKAETQALIDEQFRPIFETLSSEAEVRGWIVPRIAFGYFPCAADGETLRLYDPEDRAREVAAFSWPRQPRRQKLCLADYFAPHAPDGTARDVVPMQICTVGPEAAAQCQRLHEAGEFARELYLHGIAVQTAEALAEWQHRRVRAALGLDRDRGKRYSPGYPACPALTDQEVFLRLLPAREIGVTATSAWQLVPEASTSALIVHHPQAIYYAT